MSAGSSTDARSADLLPPGLLDGLGGLEIVARRVVQGFVTGLHRSPFTGSGDEFWKHREYRQGDDLRHLDWRLYGRTDRLYVRQFREDSNLSAYLVVDRSASMAYTGADGLSKLRYGQMLTATLAHLMLRSGDAVGLASYGGEVTLHLPPRNRPGHLRHLLLALERLESAGEEGAAGALDRVGAALRRRGRVVIVSDLLEPGTGAELARAVGRLRARGDEVMAFRVLTPEETGERPLPPGRFFDPEDPAIDVPAAPADDPAYRQRVEAWYRSLAADLEWSGAEYVPLDTGRPLVAALTAWIRSRGRPV